MKIKINKQTVKNVTDNILTINYIKSGQSFQINSADVNFDDLTSDQKALVTSFLALLESKVQA